MKRSAFALITLALLSACGTPPGLNSDVPNAVYAGLKRPVPAEVATVQEVPTGPADAVEVSGVSCKNKMWDPAPDAEAARRLMLKEAETKGFNAVHSVTVRNEPGAVMLNCWQAIVARGKAFTISAEPQL